MLGGGTTAVTMMLKLGSAVISDLIGDLLDRQRSACMRFRQSGCYLPARLRFFVLAEPSLRNSFKELFASHLDLELTVSNSTRIEPNEGVSAGTQPST